MKRIVQVLLTLAIAMALGLSVANAAEQIWSVSQGIDTPESVYFDQASHRLFVSNEGKRVASAVLT